VVNPPPVPRPVQPLPAPSPGNTRGGPIRDGSSHSDLARATDAGPTPRPPGPRSSHRRRPRARPPPRRPQSIWKLRLTEQQALETERHVRILTTLSHPHIASLWGVFTDATALHLVSPDAAPAAALLAACRGDARAVAGQVLGPVASALAYAHSVGVLHRNVHPGSLVVRADTGAVALGGWGEAVDTSRDRPVSPDRGKPAFRPLEVFCNAQAGNVALRRDLDPELRRAYTAAVDAWALGCLLCKVLADRLPYNGARDEVIIARLRSGRPALPDALEGPARELALRCLEGEPTARPSMAEVLAHPFVAGNVEAGDGERLRGWAERGELPGARVGGGGRLNVIRRAPQASTVAAPAEPPRRPTGPGAVCQPLLGMALRQGARMSVAYGAEPEAPEGGGARGAPAPAPAPARVVRAPSRSAFAVAGGAGDPPRDRPAPVARRSKAFSAAGRAAVMGARASAGGDRRRPSEKGGPPEPRARVTFSGAAEEPGAAEGGSAHHRAPLHLLGTLGRGARGSRDSRDSRDSAGPGAAPRHSEPGRRHAPGVERRAPPPRGAPPAPPARASEPGGRAPAASPLSAAPRAIGMLVRDDAPGGDGGTPLGSPPAGHPKASPGADTVRMDRGSRAVF